MYIGSQSILWGPKLHQNIQNFTPDSILATILAQIRKITTKSRKYYTYGIYNNSIKILYRRLMGACKDYIYIYNKIWSRQKGSYLGDHILGIISWGPQDVPGIPNIGSYIGSYIRSILYRILYMILYRIRMGSYVGSYIGSHKGSDIGSYIGSCIGSNMGSYILDSI